MTNERYTRVWEKRKNVDAEAGTKVIGSLKDIAPDLGRYTIDFPFGDIDSRPDLDIRSREIAVVAALAALGNAAPQLRVHIHGALNIGVSRKKIVEIITMMAVYAGFPAALNGMQPQKRSSPSGMQRVFNNSDIFPSVASRLPSFKNTGPRRPPVWR